MPRSTVVSDQEILVAIGAAGTDVTAASLNLVGVSTKRLRSTEGVSEVGSVKTGKPGRPAVLFALEPQ